MAFTVYIEHDGTETTLGNLDTVGSRTMQTYSFNKEVREFSIRIASSTEDEWLNVHQILVDIDMREEEK